MSKIAERVQNQERFRETHLTRVAKEIRLSDFDKVLAQKIKNKEEGSFELFGGKFSSLSHALAEFELERFYFGRALKNERNMYDEMVRQGLTEKQIEEIITEGKYIKFISPKQKHDEKIKQRKETNYVG